MTEQGDSNALGGRLALLAPEELDDGQRVVYDALTVLVAPEARAGRFTARLEDGRFVGPFNALLRAPAIATAMGGWTSAIAQNEMAQDVRQVAILTVGVHWGAAYEIAAHRHAAHTAGVPLQAIEDLLSGRTPQGLGGPALIAHRLTAALLGDHAVPEALYTEALATFGEPGLVALLCLIGQYQTISSILVTFEVPVPLTPNPSTNSDGSGSNDWAVQ